MEHQSEGIASAKEIQSDEEQEQHQLRLEFDRLFALTHSPAYYSGGDAILEETIQLEQSILNYSKEEIAGLLDQFKEDKDKLYTILRFFSVKADFSDRNTLIDLLDSAAVKDNTDGSNVSLVCDTLTYLVFDFRKDHGNDAIELDEIAELLIERTHVSYGNPYSKRKVQAAIAATGSAIARGYLSESGLLGDFTVNMYLSSDPSVDPRNFVTMPQFETMEEINERRRAAEGPDDDFLDWMLASDEEVPISELVDRARVRIQQADRATMAADTDVSSSSQIAEEPDELLYTSGSVTLPYDDRSKSRWRSTEIFRGMDKDKREALIRNVVVLVDDIPGLEDSVRALGRIHLFNFFLLNPQAGEEEQNFEIAKIIAMSDREQRYLYDKDFLTTIGLELEVPQRANAETISSALASLGISAYQETQNLFEITTVPSYGPSAQSRMLHELALLGVVPLQTIDESKAEDTLWNQKISRDIPLSMHINFAIPVEISSDVVTSHQHLLTAINEVLTLAYSSPERMSSRKTDRSIRWSESAEETKKSSKKPAPNNQEDGQPVPPLRIELRAGEYRDASAYRLLVDAQRLVSMFLAYINKNEDAELSRDMEAMCTEFSQEASLLFDQYGYEPHMIDRYDWSDYDETERAAELRRACRILSNKYSRLLGEYISKRVVKSD